MNHGPAGARSRWTSWRWWLGAALLAVQLGVVAYTHLVPGCCESRYFTWAPNDYASDYAIASSVNGRQLDAGQIKARYHNPARGFYEDPPQRLLHYLRRVETTYGDGDRVRLTVRYRLNGHPPRTWTWSRG